MIRMAVTYGIAGKRFCKARLKRLCRNLRLLPGKEVKDMIAPPDGMRPRCRERFLAKRSARNVICLSPEGEFMTLQRSEM
jgi:hypothetical protein